MTERKDHDGTQNKASAAESLGVSIRTIERYIEAGRLEAYKTHTGRVLITTESIEKLAEPTPIGRAA